MRKTTIILLLTFQIFLLFIFHNLHSLLKEIEKTDITKIKNPYVFMEDLKRVRKVFTALSIVTGILVVGTGFFLVFQFKKSKVKPDYKEILPLHDYLLELKGSEAQLKNLVEKQKENVIEKEELNKSIINHINSAVVFLNQAGRIDIFNAVAEQLFAQSYANAKNNLPGKILSNFPELVEFIHRAEGKKVSQEIASEERIFFIDIIPIGNIGRLLLIKDITQEKKREEIDRKNGNFIMLGEMAAFLAHEVRNSLGVIYGYSKTIGSDKDKIAKVNKEIEFLNVMMENFLNFSKPVKLSKREEIDLVDVLKRNADENRLEIHLNQDKMILESDPALIQSIFSNLILNSAQAGAGRVDVEFRKHNKDLEIILRDNGKGIEESIREKIWYPFFTTREKGTGMGLAIIRKMINTLNGEISLMESAPGGTAFNITLYG